MFNFIPVSFSFLSFSSLGLSVLDLGPMHATDRRRQTSDAQFLLCYFLGWGLGLGFGFGIGNLKHIS